MNIPIGKTVIVLAILLIIMSGVISFGGGCSLPTEPEDIVEEFLKADSVSDAAKFLTNDSNFRPQLITTLHKHFSANTLLFYSFDYDKIEIGTLESGTWDFYFDDPIWALWAVGSLNGKEIALKKWQAAVSRSIEGTAEGTIDGEYIGIWIDFTTTIKKADGSVNDETNWQGHFVLKKESDRWIIYDFRCILRSEAERLDNMSIF